MGEFRKMYVSLACLHVKVLIFFNPCLLLSNSLQPTNGAYLETSVMYLVKFSAVVMYTG